jgi:hypothetical protein
MKRYHWSESNSVRWFKLYGLSYLEAFVEAKMLEELANRIWVLVNHDD